MIVFTNRGLSHSCRCSAVFMLNLLHIIYIFYKCINNLGIKMAAAVRHHNSQRFWV
jgi:hypothetical protein